VHEAQQKEHCAKNDAFRFVADPVACTADRLRRGRNRIAILGRNKWSDHGSDHRLEHLGHDSHDGRQHDWNLDDWHQHDRHRQLIDDGQHNIGDYRNGWSHHNFWAGKVGTGRSNDVFCFAANVNV